MRWQDIEIAIPSLEEVSWSAPHKWGLPLRLSSFCLSALLSFCGTWVLGDSYEEFELASRAVDRSRASHEAAEIAASRLRDLQVQSQEVSQRIEHHAQGFLLADELPDLLDLIASLSLQHAIALESLEVEDVLSQGRFDLQPLSLSLRGSYQDIGFLHVELGNLPWPMVVDALRVTAAPSDARVLEIGVRLVVPLLSESA